MANLIVLDVVIGLVFIYLLYSMLTTILQELLATWFSFRSKLLERAIFRMLEDGSVFDKRFSSLKALFKKQDQVRNKKTLTGLFYNHPMVKYLGEDKYNSKPSYITKETFSKVMIDLLHGDIIKTGDDIKPIIEKSISEGKLALNATPIGEQTLRYIRSVWIDSQGDIDVFRKSLEQWFDDTMERCSGWYKKHTQYILLVLGFLIAILFNVNTIEIIGKLEKDPALRDAVVQQADAFTKAHPDLYQERITSLSDNKNHIVAYNKQDSVTLKSKLDSIAREKNDSLLNRGKLLTHRADSLVNGDIAKANGLLGLGWKNMLNAHKFTVPKEWNWDKVPEWIQFIVEWFVVILKWCVTVFGWLITALALSLGAPFWFDLLNKLMKLRSAMSISTSSQSKGKEEDKTVSVIRKG
jgi:hypothetical protein